MSELVVQLALKSLNPPVERSEVGIETRGSETFNLGYKFGREGGFAFGNQDANTAKEASWELASDPGARRGASTVVDVRQIVTGQGNSIGSDFGAALAPLFSENAVDHIQDRLQAMQEAWSDGKLSQEEFTEALESDDLAKMELELIFDRFDWDRNGSLSPEEFEAAMLYIVELVQRKLEQAAERKREQAQAQLATRADAEAIGAKGGFINDVFAKPIENDQGENSKAMYKATSPLRNALRLVSEDGIAGAGATG